MNELLIFFTFALFSLICVAVMFSSSSSSQKSRTNRHEITITHRTAAATNPPSDTIRTHRDVVVAKKTNYLGIAVIGCLKPKYLEEIKSCSETWFKACDAKGIHLKIFVDEIPPHLELPRPRDDFVELHCGDDYDSATPKHWLGLQYLFDNLNTDFYFVCGTDTFLNVQNALDLLKTYNPQDPCYIGGHGDDRSGVYFHSGGPGYFMSREFLRRVLPSAFDLIDEMKGEPCGPVPLACCDVQVGKVANMHNIKPSIHDDKFFHCNHHGMGCHPGVPEQATLVACHNMSRESFHEYQDFLSNR